MPIVKLMNKCILFSIFIFTSCSFLKGKDIVKEQQPSFTFKQDVEITQNGKKTKLKSGESFTLESQGVVRAEAPGSVSMVILPLSSENNKLDISLASLKDIKIDEIESIGLNRRLDLILPEIQKIQRMMLQKDYTNALSKVRDLKVQYPKVAFFSFIEGACYKILNRKSEALQAVREGLVLYPQSADARELYRQLTGEDY